MSVYVCSKCGVDGVKLWRPYQSMECTLLCADCAEESQGKRLDIGRSNEIGWYVPAVPVAGQDAFYGLSSIPEDLMEWWHAQPTREARK